jgi:hypothetical protein
MSCIVKVTGNVHLITPTKSRTSGQYTNFDRDLILFVEGKRDKYITFGASGDMCGKLDALNRGDEVTIKAEIEGFKYAKKVDGVPTGEDGYFTKLSMFEFARAGDAPAEPTTEPQAAATPVKPEQEDIPF